METIEQTQAEPQAEPEFGRHQGRSEAKFRSKNPCEAKTLMDTRQDLQAIDRFTNLLSQRAGNLCQLLQAIADATVEAIAEPNFAWLLSWIAIASGLKLSAVGGTQKFAAGKTPHVQNKLLWKAFATGEAVLWQSECGDGSLPRAGIMPAAIE